MWRRTANGRQKVGRGRRTRRIGSELKILGGRGKKN